jgi:hypothetical protein
MRAGTRQAWVAGRSGETGEHRVLGDNLADFSVTNQGATRQLTMSIALFGREKCSPASRGE